MTKMAETIALESLHAEVYNLTSSMLGTYICQLHIRCPGRVERNCTGKSSDTGIHTALFEQWICFGMHQPVSTCHYGDLQTDAWQSLSNFLKLEHVAYVHYRPNTL